MTRSVLISGGGIAGPSLAYWLGRSGYAVTVVEQAPALRSSGGSPVDFRGDQMDLLARMGIDDEIKAHQTGMGDQIVVDRTGRRVSTLPSALLSGEVEIERSDLARILYDRSKGVAEYRFDDAVTALAETPDGVEVAFARSPARRFDLVVGTDGPHSGVRRLAFGEETFFRHDLGLYVAGFRIPNDFGIVHGGVVYNEPGKFVMVNSGRDTTTALVTMIFASADRDDHRHSVEDQKRLIAGHFTGAGWRVPALLAALQDTPDLYFDSISQIRLARWSTGRIALVGDSAWCPGPGGSATGLAMLGAYTLAGELALAADNHVEAYQRYERVMREKAATSQRTAAWTVGTFLTPGTERGIRIRNALMRVASTRPLIAAFEWSSRRGGARTGTLTGYPLAGTHQPLPAPHAR
ncbi:FAD-dependent monooxygenase [Amycolatopsis sp. cmx-8-4]|uniref:FAD-dependent monooxygenase n=1 Tax=Amycolatopsis sp. cmx-8-4 TaxID=2790947 RepID=UPI003979C911